MNVSEVDAVMNASDTIIERLLHILEQKQDEIALELVAADGSFVAYSYRQLFLESFRWACCYQRLGVAAGDKVVIILRHSLSLYSAFLGAVFVGAVPAMMASPSPKLDRKTFRGLISGLVADQGFRVVVTHDDLAPEIRTIAQYVKVVVPDRDGAPREQQSVNLEVFRATPSSIAFLQYSSGTTGLKKGVMISHAALLWQVDAYASTIGLSETDVIISWLPLYHDMGLITCFWMPLLKGVKVVAMSAHDWVRCPQLLFEMFSVRRGTLCWLPNFAFAFMAERVRGQDCQGYDLSSVRGMINCSEPITEKAFLSFLEAFTPLGLQSQSLWSSYAMAETTFAVTSGGYDTPLLIEDVDGIELQRTGRVIPVARGTEGAKSMVGSGRVLANTDVRIVDGTGCLLPERVVGEIVVRSPSLVSGYVGVEPGSSSPFQDGWYKTGDLGYRVGDELVVTGRLKDLIIINGKNFYPHDIEESCLSVPGVIPGRCAAFGMYDDFAGTERLIIIAESSAESGKQYDVARGIAKELYENFDVTPSDVRIVPPGWLLKSSSGKMARSAIRDKYLALRNETGKRIQQEDALPRELRALRDIIVELSDLADAERLRYVQADELLISSGLLDSLRFMMLIVALERLYSISIPDDEQWQISNFDSLTNIHALVTRLSSSEVPQKQVISDVRERGFKCELFKRRSRSLDILILGSSRAMALPAAKAVERELQAFNFAVNNGRIEDFAAIYDFVCVHGATPKWVMLGLDIEGFSAGADGDSRLYDCAELRPYIDPTSIAMLFASRADRAFSGRLGEVCSNIRTRDRNVSSCSFLPETGDICYPADPALDRAFQLRLPLKERDIQLANQRASYKLRFQGAHALHPYRLQLIEELGRRCIERGSYLIPYLTPLHEELLSFLVSDTPYQARLDELITWWGESSVLKEFPLLNFTTVDTFRGIVDDFVDAAHIGPYNGDLLMSVLLRQCQQKAVDSRQDSDGQPARQIHIES
jgi:fatty-acyl-CoA synthase